MQLYEERTRQRAEARRKRGMVTVVALVVVGHYVAFILLNGASASDRMAHAFLACLLGGVFGWATGRWWGAFLAPGPYLAALLLAAGSGVFVGVARQGAADLVGILAFHSLVSVLGGLVGGSAAELRRRAPLQQNTRPASASGPAPGRFLLFWRLVVGAALLWTGIEKFAAPVYYADILRTGASAGLVFGLAPLWLTLWLAFVQFFAGFFLMAGLLTRLAALVGVLAALYSVWLFGVSPLALLPASGVLLVFRGGGPFTLDSAIIAMQQRTRERMKGAQLRGRD